MSLSRSIATRIARTVAIMSILLATPALAENKKVVLSQAFQSMLYLPLYVAIDEGFFTQQGLDLTKETAGAPTVRTEAMTFFVCAGFSVTKAAARSPISLLKRNVRSRATVEPTPTRSENRLVKITSAPAKR